MASIVLDASVLVEFLRWSPVGQSVAEVLLRPDISAHAPHLASVEVLSAFRSLVARGGISATRAGFAIDDLADLPVTRHPAEPFLSRIWQLRANITAYDATYIALAEALDAPLLTADRRLAQARGNDADVRFIDRSRI